MDEREKGSSEDRTNGIPRFQERKEEMLRRIEGRHPLVFLDYDGTLSPIVERPEDAHLPDEMRERIRRLADSFIVAVVSGRDLRDVRRRVGLDQIVYAGSHGFDIEGPDGLRMEHEEASALLPDLDRIEDELREEVEPIEGSEVERKKFSIAVHYRRTTPEDARRVEEVVDEIMTGHPKLRKTSGKKVFDLQPALDWHKGKAVLWLLEMLGRERDTSLPIYIGDDTTDEDAFDAIRGLGSGGGIGIVVQDEPVPSAAHYRVKDPDEVAKVLDFLARIDPT